MKLTVIVTLANNNEKSDNPTTLASITVYDRTEGETVFFTQTETKTKNTTIGAYAALKEYFDWLENESGYRSKVELEFVCKDLNTNKSLVKLCKTYYLLRNTWKARIADFARKGYRGNELRREKLLLIQRLLTANHKADEKVMVAQRNIIAVALETLTPRYTAGFEIWSVMVKKLWTEDEYKDLREVVKAAQSQLIKENGWHNEIHDAGKYKKPAK